MGVIHLIRHGQATWQDDNYDQLSDLGREQSAALGMAWEASEQRWTHAITGSMERHLGTAVEVIEGAGFGDGYDIDDRWNEFDHLALTGHVDAASRPKEPKEFQSLLNTAIGEWMNGADGAGETFIDFSHRVLSAFDDACAMAGKGQTVVVFSSGGPISLISSQVLAGDASLFMALNTVMINASLTTIIVGQDSRRLLTFNEHGHIPKSLVTYR